MNFDCLNELICERERERANEHTHQIIQTTTAHQTHNEHIATYNYKFLTWYNL